MTQHQIGYDVSNECGIDALLNHLQLAFKVDNEMHEQVLEETRNMEVNDHKIFIKMVEKLTIFSYFS